jgi:hypothetical protein
MRTKDFCAAIEAGFDKAYDNKAGFTTVPYLDKDSGEMKDCLGCLLTRTEHFAVVVAHAAHWIVADPDLTFDHENADLSLTYEQHAMDVLEDFYNLVGGMKTAPYMQWTCIYFPGLTEEQVLASSEAEHDPQLLTDTAVGRDPVTGVLNATVSVGQDGSIDPKDGSFIPPEN